MIKKGDVIEYEVDGGFRNVVLEDVLKMYVEKAPVELVSVPTRPPRRGKVAVSDTLDLTAYEVVESLFKENVKKLRLNPVEGKVVKPLYLFLDQEVLLYAKLRRLKFKSKIEKRDKLNLFIDNLEKKHPEIKRAIVNSYLEFC